MEDTQTWLNQDYLGSILRASIKGGIILLKDLSIMDYKVKRSVEKDRNDSSNIYKVQVFYKHKTEEIKEKTYIIKKKISSSWIDSKEKEIYKVLPKIEQYSNSKLAPKIYMCTEDSLVLEDLSEQGFQNANLKLLDYAHCAVALKSLAKFHAGSVLLHRNNPKVVEENVGREILLNTEVDLFGKHEKNLLNLGEEIAAWPESRQYAKYIPKIAKKIRRLIENLPKKDCLKVLNHGDFCNNNLMFKYESGEVYDVRFVGFQCCRYAPPTWDLFWLVGSSADLDVRQNRLDELFTVYLNTLNATLTDLKIFRSITKQQFDESLKENFVMYFMGLIGSCVVLVDHEDTQSSDLEGVDGIKEDNTNKTSDMMKSKQYRNFISAVFNDLDKRGVFQSFRE